MILWLLTLPVLWAAPDRTAPPDVRPADQLSLSERSTETIRPGVRVHWVHVPGVRHVVVDVQLGRGCLHLDARPTPACDELGSLWTVAARGLPAGEVEERASLANAQLSAHVGLRDAGVTLTVPRDTVDEGWSLLHDLFRSPTFPGSELRRDVRDTLQWWSAEAPNSPRAVAWSAMNHAWWPADHPEGARPDPKGLARVRSAELRRHHARLLAESPIEVTIVGDLQPDVLRDRLQVLLDGIGADAPVAPPLPPRPQAPTRVIAVDMPDAEQVVVLLGTDAPPRDHADAPAFEAIQYALGGHFLSRFNRNLREDKGFTYGASSRYLAEPHFGYWALSVEVATANVEATLTEVARELILLALGGVLDDEQQAFATSLVSAWNTTLQTGTRAADTYIGLARDHETLATAQDRLRTRLALDVAPTARVASTWLTNPDRVWVVVGPRSALAPVLEAQFGEVSWIAPQQAILGTASDGATRP